MKCRNSGVYHYTVAFCPDVDSLWMRYKLLKEQRTRDITGDVSVSCLPIVPLAVKRSDGRLVWQISTILTQTRNWQSVFSARLASVCGLTRATCVHVGDRCSGLLDDVGHDRRSAGQRRASQKGVTLDRVTSDTARGPRDAGGLS